MGLAVPLLALPFLGAAVFALRWVNRRLPPGWKGVGLGFAALGVISLLTIGGWILALLSITWANYVCTDCGRAEKQTRFGPLVVARSMNSDGEEYVRRFAPALSAGHAHQWHLESCEYNAIGVGCTLERVGGWFEVLPKLANREAADELFREAQSLPYKKRCEFMQEVSDRISIPALDAQGPDHAFEAWRAHRADAPHK